LAHVLRHLPATKDKRVLVGPSTRDDAAVFRLSKDQALIATTDFFTPIVDDPFVFGRIAAANALSDVYAMGGTPLYALSLVGFPLATLGAETLGRILEGATDACAEAGIEIVGGHSIDDPEPKFGLAVTGLVHPKAVRSNAKGRPGDLLVLTKPLGSGLASTAIKRGVPTPAAEAAIQHMSTLNRAAGEVFAKKKVNALTDVTGFGLLGHLWNIVEASKVAATVRFDDVPLMPGAAELAQVGVVPGGSKRNLSDIGPHVSFPADLPEWKRLILADAQTNGGLLATVPRRELDGVLRALRRRKIPAAVIGHLSKGEPVITVE
jgi:selenide,water dikinase